MADNIKTDTNVQSADTKPCFETSSERIFLNLHLAASQNAAKVLGIRFSASEIGATIINTGVSEDGNSIVDRIVKDKNKKFFGGTGHYELGIVLEFTDFKTADISGIKEPERIIDKINEFNKSGIETLRKRAYEGIKEYFRWFSGEKSFDGISEEDLMAFVPDYNGRAVKISKYVIQNMEPKAQVQYFTDRQDKTDKNGNVTKGKSGTQKPRVGFKIGYNLFYDKAENK